MTIDVVWKSYNCEPNKGYWDQNMLDMLFTHKLWNPVNKYQFSYKDDFEGNETGAVVVIAARYLTEFIDKINQDISKLGWCLLVVAGDEESSFPVEKLKHPKMKVWLMTPHAGKQYLNVDRFIGEGFPPLARKIFQTKDALHTRENNWFFAGQNTHKRRKEFIDTLRQMEHGELIETDGFTKGVSQDAYYYKMMNAKVIPCPSGPETPDSFRFYEALEAGCVPIADAISTKNETEGYWNMLFGEDIPFPKIKDIEPLEGTVHFHADVYPLTNNKVFSWWQKYKRQLAYNLQDDLDYLLGSKVPIQSLKDRITVLVPTSPINIHPDTRILEETISTIRSKLPESEIIIMMDGVREEQSDKSKNYEEYIRRVLWKANYEWKNILPLRFDKHTHQTGMTREALKLVKTPQILFVEHDTPITPDQIFEFEGMCEAIDQGEANMIRFHYESHILDVHKHLMLDETPQLVCGVPMLRTAQWSQRPHLASTKFYIRMLNDYFSADALCMIEDGIHGKVAEAFRQRGKSGWNEFKVWMYSPEGNIKRSYHSDGRGTDSKFDEKFKY